MPSLADFMNQKTNELLTRATLPAPTVAPKPIVTLAPESDTGTKGDNITALSAVTLKIQNPTDLAWAEPINGSTTGSPGIFDPGLDILASLGKLYVTLRPGSNTFAVYQQQGNVVSDASYINIYLDPVQSAQHYIVLHKLAISYFGRPLTPAEVQVGTTVLAQTGGDPASLVDYLSSTPEFVMQYHGLSWDSALDRAYQSLYGRNSTTAEKQYWFGQVSQGVKAGSIPWHLANQATGRDASVLAAKTLFAEEATKLHTKLIDVQPGSLSSERILAEAERLLLSKVLDQPSLTAAINSLEVITSSKPNIIQKGTGALVGTTLSLEFDRPIDWQRLDLNGDGKYTIRFPGQGGELQLAIGGTGGFALKNTPFDWTAKVPSLGSHFLTIENIDRTASDENATVSVLVVGLPDMQDGIISNVLFDNLRV